MSKGRKNISDEQKRLRGTDQPCRTARGKARKRVSGVSGSVIPANALPTDSEQVSGSVTPTDTDRKNAEGVSGSVTPTDTLPETERGVSESVTLADNPPLGVQGVPRGVSLTSIPKSGLKGTAKKVYTLVATELMNRGALDALSSDLVVAYCREMALYHDMMRDLDREGMTVEVETKGGGVVTQANPKRKIAEGALSQAKSLASEFGLTPASRARVLALFVNNAPKDDFADFESLEEQ